jgi:lipoprotein
MKTKRFLSLVLLSAIVVSCLVVSTEATEYQGRALTYVVDATGSFDTDVPANTTVKAKRSFPLEVGEVVTIKATYSPFSASVDFGLIAPDNLFYGLNTKNGSFDEEIEVTQRGNYVLAVRNNSSQTIHVSGHVNY